MKHSYILDFKEFNSHFVKVTFCFTAKMDNPKLWLPTWIAGSYMIREFSKHISQVVYEVNHIHYRAEKLTKNQWQLNANAGDTITVHYPVYCYDLSVRTAYVDSERIFGNFSSLLLMVDGDDEGCAIEISVPKAFYENNQGAILASGLKHSEQFDGDSTIYRFEILPNGEPLTAFEAMDFPFEIAVQSQFEFMTTLDSSTYPHRFFVSGRHSYEENRLKDDVQAICQAYVDKLGWVPFSNYTFMTYASKSDYGGLEHINSTALVIPRDNLPVGEQVGSFSDNYLQYLGLCSHEYFHAWWVKSVRPDVMMTARLQTEAYTPLLWVFEGFTSYIDDLMLYVSKRINKSQYFNLLASQFARYLNTQGRTEQTVAESSFDAWIKLYRPDENSTNSTISYYNKGAIVAWGLDLLLCEYGYRLFDVVREYVGFAKTSPSLRFGMTCANLDEVMAKFLPSEVWANFRDNYVNGVTPVPFNEWLGKQNTEMTVQGKDEPFGIICEPNPSGLLVKRLPPNSAAARAGLSANDVIVAIDGLRADVALLGRVFAQAQKTSQPTKLHAFRRDMLLTFDITPTDEPVVTVKVSLSGDGDWLDK